MKLVAMTTMAAMTAAAAQARSNIEPYGQVVVCMETPNAPVNPILLPLARTTASELFAEIGVKVEWVRGLSGCPDQGILVSMSLQTPESLKPGALAYALPYEGTHICVFFDRIATHQWGTNIGYTIGYVLAHEITHILQGIARHSATGVMKANWKAGDFAEMTLHRLRFEEADITLIYDGLAKRAAQAKVAMNAANGGAGE